MTDSYKTACAVAKFLDDKKGANIAILNISNVSVLADYFVICSADTTTQVRALTEHVKDSIKKQLQRRVIGGETDSKSRWNLLDYGDVVVHILHREERELYAIEKFWNHACIIPTEEWEKTSKEVVKD